MGNIIDYLILAAYFIPILAAGYWGYSRAKDPDNFLVAGRNLGPTLFVGTLAAMTLGGASTIGGVSLGYQYGLSGMWLVVMLGLGVGALSLLFSSRLANLGIFTYSEMLKVRYQRSTGLAGAAVMGVYEITLLVTQIIAIGTIFNVFFGFSPALAIVGAGGAVLLYSVMGGMWAISLTDIIQFVVMTVGILLILLPLAIFQAGGFGGMSEQLPASYFNLAAIGWQTIFTYFLLYFLGAMVGQEFWQRVFTARGPRIAKWGGLAASGYCVIYGIAGALIGSAAKTLLPNLSSADNAFAEMATTLLPTGLRGLVLAAALAAIMSSASAFLMAASTIFANDVYGALFTRDERVGVATNRLFMILVGAVSLALAFLVDDVVGGLTIAFDLLVGALFVPVIGALFWRRATSAGALASIAVGGVVVVTLLVTRGLFSNDPIIYGLLASGVAFVVVSLLTPRPSSEKLAAWEQRMKNPASTEEAASERSAAD